MGGSAPTRTVATPTIRDTHQSSYALLNKLPIAYLMPCLTICQSQRNPMNQRDPTEGYVEDLKPLIHGAREARLKAETAKGKGEQSSYRNVPGPGYRSKL